VRASLERFGFVAPIVVWRGGDRMVAGHTRLKATRAIIDDDPSFAFAGSPGAGFVRVVFADFKSEADADAYAIADNRLGSEARWDDDALADILSTLRDDDAELLAATGFDDRELAFLIASDEVPSSDPVEVGEHTRGEIVDEGKSDVTASVRNSDVARAKAVIVEALEAADIACVMR
jgi:ParB-like chromosome segregation protein Spo0J